MAPLSQAIAVEYTPSSGHDVDRDQVYHGIVDGDWCIGSVPNGGFSLSLLLQACIQYQSSTKHPDPIKVTAHYLHAIQVASFEVRVRTMKTGRGFSNILADFMQNNRKKITAHIIFGVLAPSSMDPGPHLTLSPPSPYARRHPLHSHPSNVTPESVRSSWTYSHLVRWSRDPVYLERNKPDSPTRTNSTTVGGGGVEWGAWVELTSKGETITTPSLCFFGDIFEGMTRLLPESERVGLGPSWLPTLNLSVEFKFPIPRPSSDFADRTVGVYVSAQFMNDPQGRHNVYAEIWTAPSNIGEGEAAEGWRDKQVCLAICTQMAITVPMELNHSRPAKM